MTLSVLMKNYTFEGIWAHGDFTLYTIAVYVVRSISVYTFHLAGASGVMSSPWSVSLNVISINSSVKCA